MLPDPFHVDCLNLADVFGIKVPAQGEEDRPPRPHS